MKNKRKSVIASFLAVIVMINMSCVDNFLPESKTAFDRDVAFTQTLFEPVMGHTTFYTGIFNSANASLPLTFEITDIKHTDGTPATELMEYYPVKVWRTPYLGNEKSLEEINAKRSIEYRRLFDVRKHTGEFIMWSEANSSILRCQPDSGYTFIVNVSNSGGYKTFKQMRLMPKREVDFEPTIYDSNTGLPITEYVNPDNILMQYESTNRMIDKEDVHIYFKENKDDESPNSSLTISFYDQEWKPIDPRKFNETSFDKLFQAGFLKEITSEQVKYDMAYPLPLFKETTSYTNTAGDKAHVRFSASYLSRYNIRRTVYLELDLAIYKEAHWKILVHFANGFPMLGAID
ncbi:MAG: DUF5007 domain-containing protein [Prevotella sp.]|nr:DUF5007 domain-containing protein [Prevotella sp.]